VRHRNGFRQDRLDRHRQRARALPFRSRDSASRLCRNRSGAKATSEWRLRRQARRDGTRSGYEAESIASNSAFKTMKRRLIKWLDPNVQMSPSLVLRAAPRSGVSHAEVGALAKQKPGLSYATGSARPSRSSIWLVQCSPRSPGIGKRISCRLTDRAAARRFTDLLGGRSNWARSDPRPGHLYKKARCLLAQIDGNAIAKLLPGVPRSAAGIRGSFPDQGRRVRAARRRLAHQQRGSGGNSKA